MSIVYGFVSAPNGLRRRCHLVAGKEPRFYLVQEDILPEAIGKTVRAKELLLAGEVSTVAEAVKKVNLSRSAFYKYKDKVYPFNRWNRDQSLTLEIMLEHRSGILSSVLNGIAAAGGNIVTINQNLPQQGFATATVTIETAGLNCDPEKLLKLLHNTTGVKRAKLLGT